MKKVKSEITEGTELPNQECIRTLGEKEKYLGLLEANTFEQIKMIEN